MARRLGNYRDGLGRLVGRRRAKDLCGVISCVAPAGLGSGLSGVRSTGSSSAPGTGLTLSARGRAARRGGRASRTESESLAMGPMELLAWTCDFEVGVYEAACLRACEQSERANEWLIIRADQGSTATVAVLQTAFRVNDLERQLTFETVVCHDWSSCPPGCRIAGRSFDGWADLFFFSCSPRLRSASVRQWCPVPFTGHAASFRAM